MSANLSFCSYKVLQHVIPLILQRKGRGADGRPRKAPRRCQYKQAWPRIDSGSLPRTPTPRKVDVAQSWRAGRCKATARLGSILRGNPATPPARPRGEDEKVHPSSGQTSSFRPRARGSCSAGGMDDGQQASSTWRSISDTDVPLAAQRDRRPGRRTSPRRRHSGGLPAAPRGKAPCPVLN